MILTYPSITKLLTLRKAFALLMSFTLAVGSAQATAFEIGVTDTEILLGQSLGLTGPLAELTLDISNGARAYVNEVNARGDIHGRLLKFITMDDGYQATNTVRMWSRWSIRTRSLQSSMLPAHPITKPFFPL